MAAPFGPLFGTEWVYTSSDPGKVITFAYLTVCILRDYHFGFDKLYTLIRDYLREKDNHVPKWVTAAEREWDLVRREMKRETGSQWQRVLRKYMNNLTDLYTDLAMMFAASPVEHGQPFSVQTAKRLAFFAEATVVYFEISFK
jgi:hypothetical protein